jgi:integrase
MRLTERFVENAKPDTVRREIADSHLVGLYLIIQPITGAKSWAIRYRHHGTPRKYTIGRYPTFSLKQAREAGGKALRAVAEGRDPGRERQEVRSDAFGTIAADFIERHCKRNNRESTTKTRETLLRLHVLPKWEKRPIQGIKRRDVIELLDNIPFRVACNRTHEALATLFGWAIQVGIIEDNPIRDVKKMAKERPRDRVLNDEELTQIWNGATALNNTFGLAVKVLMLTGARRNEVLEMRWAEVDMNKRLWSLPGDRVKNDRAHEVPLSDAVMAILESLPRNGDLVFANVRGKVPSAGVAKAVLDKAIGEIEPWRLHDLRRSAASGMARLGINLPVIEKVLNHQSGSFAGIVGVYQRHDYAGEKRKALEMWASHIEGLVSTGRAAA